MGYAEIVIVAASCFNILTAHAAETVCQGTRYVMEDGVAVTLIRLARSTSARFHYAWKLPSHLF